MILSIRDARHTKIPPAIPDRKSIISARRFSISERIRMTSKTGKETSDASRPVLKLIRDKTDKAAKENSMEAEKCKNLLFGSLSIISSNLLIIFDMVKK